MSFVSTPRATIAHIRRRQSAACRFFSFDRRAGHWKHRSARAGGLCVRREAPQRGTIHGQVLDPLGAAVPGAEVTLLSGASVVATSIADARGVYSLALLKNGRYRIRAAANTFDPSITTPRFLSVHASTAIDLVVATPTNTEQITVTATGTPTPIAQVAASVTVLNDDQFPHVRDLQEPLRLYTGRSDYADGPGRRHHRDLHSRGVPPTPARC